METSSAEDSPQRLVSLAARIAREAGALLRERFEGGREQTLRSKSSPTDLVSEADLLSERTIRARIAEHRPDDGFLGEESGAGDEGSSGLRWVVDPLDGTINFLYGIPQWCVSIAVEDGDGTLAGVVFDPLRDELFAATRDGPAELNGSPLGPGAAGRPRAAALSAAMVATGFAYDADVRAAQSGVLAALIPRVRDVRRFGSAALDLAWTATGRYDAYFERTVRPWDIAAGVLVCQRAGLEVAALQDREGLPWGILAAPAALTAGLLAIVD